MDDRLLHGAEIIIRNWVRLRAWERLLIVSGQRYALEVDALRAAAKRAGGRVETMMLDDLSVHVGEYFNDKEDAFRDYDAIIGATEYSLITTKAVKYAISRKKRFLSLPLSTNNGQSMLTYDFLNMDTRKSRIMAQTIMHRYDSSSRVEITTELGTHLRFSKEDRPAGFFNGCCRDGKGLSSASVEVYVPIIEDKTEGTLILDGSMGYIGLVTSPVAIEIRNGRIVSIEQNESGRRLSAYIQQFRDPENMVVAAELGIGLNTFSRCSGNCYIEDESAYGTFHIGFGRNIALGGVHEASGHFDLVTHNPNIYVDNRMIMDRGQLTILEPAIYI